MKQSSLLRTSLFLLLLVFSTMPYDHIANSESNTSIPGSIHIECINHRFFLWIEPNTLPPEQGYPVLFLFHGASQHGFSWIIGLNTWSKNQMSFTKKALEQGYFTICLESNRPVRPGPRAWDVFDEKITENDDIQYIKQIISWLETTNFPVNRNNLFCAGFSSGAFMCSRIGLSTSDIFTAIALNSGCNANSITLTNRGPQFDLTTSFNISSNHPPTFLLHGEQDQLVPVNCSKRYHLDLKKAGIDTDLIIDPDKGHIWLSQQNDELLNWFNSYRV